MRDPDGGPHATPHHALQPPPHLQWGLADVVIADLANAFLGEPRSERTFLCACDQRKRRRASGNRSGMAS
jgi:hypothetical protein